MTLVRTLSLGALSGLGYGATTYAEKHHGPEGKRPTLGSKIVYKGQEHTVIGWFGATKKTIENIDATRELYFGDKKTAQGYAKNRAKQANDPATVVMLVGKSLPDSRKDLNPSRFEMGPNPLSPEGLKRLNVQFVHSEPVTPQTQEGHIANFKRMLRRSKSLP